VASVGAVALGALLGAAAGGRLGRLGQMHLRADRLQLLDDEAPAGGCLQRDLELLAAEAGREAAHPGAVGRRDPLARDLAGLAVEPVGGDLRSVLVKSHYDRHSGPPQAPRSKTPARPRAALELRRSLHVCKGRIPAHAIYVKQFMLGREFAQTSSRR
jgi:hypothetical protein